MSPRSRYMIQPARGNIQTLCLFPRSDVDLWGPGAKDWTNPAHGGGICCTCERPTGSYAESSVFAMRITLCSSSKQCYRGEKEVRNLSFDDCCERCSRYMR